MKQFFIYAILAVACVAAMIYTLEKLEKNDTPLIADNATAFARMITALEKAEKGDIFVVKYRQNRQVFVIIKNEKTASRDGKETHIFLLYGKVGLNSLVTIDYAKIANQLDPKIGIVKRTENPALYQKLLLILVNEMEYIE